MLGICYGNPVTMSRAVFTSFGDFFFDHQARHAAWRTAAQLPIFNGPSGGSKEPTELFGAQPHLFSQRLDRLSHRGLGAFASRSGHGGNITGYPYNNQGAVI